MQMEKFSKTLPELENTEEWNKSIRRWDLCPSGIFMQCRIVIQGAGGETRGEETAGETKA